MLRHAATKRPQTPPGGRRVGAAEVERRLAVVESLLREGRSRSEVVNEMAARFGASTRTADDYIARVREAWAGNAGARREAERGATIARLEDLSRKAEKRGNFAAAVAAERLLADVRGVRAPQELEVRTTQAQPPPEVDLTEEQIVEELSSAVEVLARALARGPTEPTRALAEAARELAEAVGLALCPPDEPTGSRGHVH
jgi:transposase